jgi:hypothetical protein
MSANVQTIERPNTETNRPSRLLKKGLAVPLIE